MILASLLWVTDGNECAVIAIIILLQLCVLCGTSFLVLALVRQTTRQLWPSVAAGIFLVHIGCEFFLWFQFTHDSWLTLLALDVLIAGLCWGKPLDRWQSALRWGLFGGLCALINPIVAMTWGILTAVIGVRQHDSGKRLGLALVLAFLILMPWMVRNYLHFGRWIPVKSNLACELYQSQCIGPDGLVEHPSTFASHPYTAPGPERTEFNGVGEMAYLDRKANQFWQAVRADPLEFGARIANRLLAATLWYVPFDPQEESEIPGWTLLRRLVHPWPFLALLFLLGTARRQPLHPAQWTAIGLYCLYLLPYVVISYYDRYAMVLVGAKVLLVVWGVDRLLVYWAVANKEPGVLQTRQPRLPIAVPAAESASRKRSGASFHSPA